MIQLKVGVDPLGGEPLSVGQILIFCSDKNEERYEDHKTQFWKMCRVGWAVAYNVLNTPPSSSFRDAFRITKKMWRSKMSSAVDRSISGFKRKQLITMRNFGKDLYGSFTPPSGS